MFSWQDLLEQAACLHISKHVFLFRAPNPTEGAAWSLVQGPPPGTTHFGLLRKHPLKIYTRALHPASTYMAQPLNITKWDFSSLYKINDFLVL